MATAIGDLVARLRMDTRGFTAGGRVATTALSGVTKAIGAVAAAVGGTYAVTQAARLGAKIASDMEQAEIAFGTMLGSADAAKATLADLTQFAAKTPFELPGITEAARGLIMFGERGPAMMDTMRILGNSAAGTSSDFAELALIYNQIRGVGKLLTQDFRQLSTRGVISLADIAKHFKVTNDEAQKLISTGKVGFEDVRTILERMSEDGGRFANMMEKQSESLGGLYSTLKDNFGMAMAGLFKHVMPEAKEAVRSLSEVFDWIRNTFGAEDEISGATKDVSKVGQELDSVAKRAENAGRAMREAFTKGQQQARAARIEYENFILGQQNQARNVLGAPVLDMTRQYREQAKASQNAALGISEWQAVIAELERRVGSRYMPDAVRNLANAAREAEMWQKRAEGRHGATDWMKDMQSRLFQLTTGVDDFAASFTAIATAPGVTTEQLARMKAMYTRIRELEKVAELRDYGKDLAKSVMTTPERIWQEMKKLDALRKTPFGQNEIMDEAYRRRLMEMRQELAPEQQARYSGAMQRGSVEAYSTILNAGKDSDKTAKAHLNVAKQTRDVLLQIDRRLEPNQTVSIPSA